MSERKQVLGIYGAASSHWVGDGFPVQTVFPSQGVPELSPFLMLDYAGPAHFKPATHPRGVEEHPHRGFETVTISYHGNVDHRDSGGNAARSIPVTFNG
jgi:quercetin 2,3-dioxygenase